MKTLYRIIPVVLALGVALGAAGAAFADDQGPQNQNATIAITGGNREVFPKAVLMDAVTLDGQVQTTLGDSWARNQEHWQVKDYTGTGAGWHVNVWATDFVNNADSNHIIPLAGFSMKLDASTLAKDDSSSSDPSLLASLFANYTGLGDSAHPASFLSAAAEQQSPYVAGQGMGSFLYDPAFQLVIPAQTYAGGYTSVVTVQIAAAP